MKQEEIEALAGHRNVPPWVVKLVGDAVAKEREALCAAMEDRDTWDMYDPAATAIEVIRARGQK